MADKLFTTFWIYSESMGVFGRLCPADAALVELEPDARFIPDKPHDIDCTFDPVLNKWVPVVIPEPTPEEAREAMPALTARQFWKAALEIDITEDSLITEMADPSSPCFLPDEKERQDAIVDIRKATTFERTYPTLNKLATAKGIPPEQLDSLWSWAALQEK